MEMFQDYVVCEYMIIYLRVYNDFLIKKLIKCYFIIELKLLFCIM